MPEADGQEKATKVDDQSATDTSTPPASEENKATKTNEEVTAETATTAETVIKADTATKAETVTKTETVTTAKMDEQNEKNTKIEPTISADSNNKELLFDSGKIDLLNDLLVAITIEIGRAQIKIRDLLSLNKGSIIELNKLAGEPVDVYANGKMIASGNIITANGKYCVRLIAVSEKNKSGMDDHKQIPEHKVVSENQAATDNQVKAESAVKSENKIEAENKTEVDK